jgi:bifunctional enzyme CysN/CysC
LRNGISRGCRRPDQLAALKEESQRFGTTGGDTDFSLLLDGLEDERQQRITIDVAYRFFATPRRSVIVADSPGHEQYTRNMATGASTADLAVLLVDARKGSLICWLFGLRHMVLAVNKLDLVGFDRGAFDQITEDSRGAATLDFASVVAILLSARYGHNLTACGDASAPCPTSSPSTNAPITSAPRICRLNLKML